MAVAISTILIWVSEGMAFDVFVAWNLLPVIGALFIYSYAKIRGNVLYGAYGFLIGSMLLSGYVHLAWLFDWGGMKSGSSTAGLVFIFTPVYSLVAGTVGFIVGAFTARGYKPNKALNADP